MQFRNGLLLCVLLPVANVANAADWKFIDDTSFADVFVDLDTVVVDGRMRTVWEKYDLKERNVPPIDNWRSRVIYDCKALRMKRLTTLTYDGDRHLGSINILDKEWQDMPPDSNGMTQLKAICSLKTR